MTNIAVYTAIFGPYPIRRTDITCFTSDQLFVKPVLDAKRFKVLPHLYFPWHEYTVWVDGNIRLKRTPEAIVETYLGDDDFGLFAHPYRKTVWQEFEALRTQPRFADPFLQKQLAEQAAFYREAGLPADAQLYECNFMVRRNVERVSRIMDAWWSEICRWQWRDQVSLPYVLWKHGIDVRVRKTRDANIRSHKDFAYTKHH